MEIFGAPIDRLAGIAGGWLAALSVMGLVVRKIANGDWIPKSTHEAIVNPILETSESWRTAYFGLLSVHGETTAQGTEWLEVARIVRDFIAAQERADAIEAALRRGDKP